VRSVFADATILEAEAIRGGALVRFTPGKTPRLSISPARWPLGSIAVRTEASERILS
jgi:hypothetical protein